MKNITIGLLVVALTIASFIAGGTYFSKTVVQLGAQPGREFVESPVFKAGVSYGPRLDITDTTNTTMTAAQICNYGFITWAAPFVNASATLPSAASLQNACLRNVGDEKIVVIKNTTSTGAWVLAGGTSSTLVAVNTSTNTKAFVAGSELLVLRLIYGTKETGVIDVIAMETQ